MKPYVRWALVLLAGLILLVLPTVLRFLGPKQNTPSVYVPPTVVAASIAATPIPTATPIAMVSPAPELVQEPPSELARGSVVVDLAHFSLIDRNKFQPLAAQLASHGLDLDFWLPTVNAANVKEITDFPDLSDELSRRLAGANALVVISPYFLYTPSEIAVVRKFVADGGRLLIISDPDVESDAARDTNQLASAFNIVFNDDYLYDTFANDQNYTHFFQGDFYDRAEALAGSRIAFYGGRSIGGAVIPEVRSAPTTLSSLRNGLTSFNTVVLGGTADGDSAGRVLAMSDFDVLTDPYVARHDNHKMLDFVADFLAGASRANTIVDFPAFFGKRVALAIDNTAPVGAAILSKAAALQQMLQDSGRTLELASGSSLAELQGEKDRDLIYIAGYRTAGSQTPLLSELGITLTEEIITPTVNAQPPVTVTTVAEPAPIGATPALGTPITATATPVPTSPSAPPTALPPLETVPPPPPPITSTTGSAALPIQSQFVTPTGAPTPGPLPPANQLTTTAQVTVSAAITAAVAASVPSATATPQPTPQVKLYLEREDGLRLVAAETQLFVRQPITNGHTVLAVLGADEQSIGAAVTRLLNRDFAGCLAQDNLLICPYSPGAGATTSSASPSPAPSAPSAAGSSPGEAKPAGSPTPVPTVPEAPPGSAGDILIVDDNRKAAAGEKSEAAIYLTVLTEAGYKVDIWVTGEQGPPAETDLAPYKWVIWSDASYAASGVSGDALRVISGHINEGGHLTISSRMPFFGVGSQPPSPIKDVIIANEIPDLVKGLPKAPIALAAETPPLNPLQANSDPEANARIALSRGPSSGNAGAPILMLLSDQNMEQPKGASLMLFSMSMGWLPNDVSAQLIQNMAKVMAAR